MSLPDWSRSMTINLVFGHRWQTPFTVLYLSKENTACKTKKSSIWRVFKLCCVMLQAREKDSDSPSGYYTCKSWTAHQYILTMISRLLPVSQITPRSCHAGRGAVNSGILKFGDPQTYGWLREREREMLKAQLL